MREAEVVAADVLIESRQQRRVLVRIIVGLAGQLCVVRRRGDRMLLVEAVIDLHVEKRVVEDRVAPTADEIGVLSGAVRRRNDGRHLLRDTAHARPRNDVAGKRLARPRRSLAPITVVRRIVDGARRSGGGSQIREIPIQKRDGRGRVKRTRDAPRNFPELSDEIMKNVWSRPL